MSTHAQQRPRDGRRVGTTAALALLALVLPPATSTAAGTMTVASGVVGVGDDGLCSLREAVANAEADAQLHADCPAGSGADVITLAGGTYLLGSGRAGGGDSALVITTEVALVGAGSVARDASGPTVLDAGGAARHLEVADGAVLQLEGLRLTNGDGGSGGAVRNEGTATARDVWFTANRGDTGGALWSSGTLVLTDVVLTDNAADGGAAIDVVGGSLTLVDSVVSDNVSDHAASRTAVVDVSGADAVVARSTIRQNVGTGIRFSGLGSSMTISASTISGNRGAMAGGVEVVSPLVTCSGEGCPPTDTTLAIRDSTISGNRASGVCGGTLGHDCTAGNGGIHASHLVPGTALDPGTKAATLHLLNVTVVGNDSAGAQVAAAGATAHNTVIADAVTGANCDETDDAADGVLWSGGANVSDDGSCGSGGFTTIVAALLGPLGSNGGPTLTHLPHPASPLIDAGDASRCAGRTAGSTTDQRGLPRIVGSSCDVGAVEADAGSLLAVLAGDVTELEFQTAPHARDDGRRRSLLVKLEGATEAFDRGDHDAARGELGAFQHHVEAHAGSAIADADARRLTAGALTIVELLPEGTVPPDDN